MMLLEFSNSLLYIELFFSEFSDTTIVLQLLFDLIWFNVTCLIFQQSK